MSAKSRSRRRAEALRLLVRTSRPHRKPLVYGALATIGVVAMRLALPWPLRGIVENVFPTAAGSGGPMEAGLPGNPVLLFCGLYLLMSIGVGSFEWIQRVWMARTASGTAHDLRTLAVSRLGPGDTRSAAEMADLITRVVGDVARIRADLKGILIHLWQNALLLLAITALFLVIAPKLGLLFLVSGLFAIWIGYRAVEKVARTTSKARSKESAYAAAIQDEEEDDDDERESVAISGSSTRKDVRTTRIIGRSTLLVHAVVAATISLALWLGVGEVRAGVLAPGELFLFIAYAITIQRRAVMIGRQVARGGKLLANTERLANLIASGPEDTAPLPALANALNLEGARVRRFPTQGRQSRLGPVTLSIPAGQHVLVLGGEGSGKSSLLALLAGRLEARRGSVRWDGQDVSGRPEALRASVSYLSDEPRFGRIAVRRLLGLAPDAEPGSADRAALEAVGAWRVVRGLRRGLGQRIPSSNLSPGERRALLIGRAVVGDASVWILDAPVDSRRSRDRRRLEAILERGRGRTLIVALGLAVAADRFDRVVVMRRGRVAFDGAPGEWRRWKQQLRRIEQPEGETGPWPASRR